MPVAFGRRVLLPIGALVPLLEAFSTVPVAVHALWPRQAHVSPQVRYIVDQLVARAAAGELR